MTSVHGGSSPESVEQTGTGGHYSGDSSQHCVLKLSGTSELHLEDTEFRDMKSITTQNANGHENGGGSFTNSLEVKTKIQKQEASANDSSFPSTKSDIEVAMQEELVNSSSHNEGLEDAKDVKLLENPQESARATKELEIVSSMERESTESNVNRIDFESQNFHGVIMSEPSRELEIVQSMQRESRESNVNLRDFESANFDGVRSSELDMQEELTNIGSHNQGLEHENDVKLLENPQESARDTKELEIVPSTERQSMESNVNRIDFDSQTFDGLIMSEPSKELEIVASMQRNSRESNVNWTDFESENFDGVRTSEHREMTEISSIEISNAGEQKEDSWLNGEKDDALDKGSQKGVRLVNGLKGLDLHFNELPKQDKHEKHSATLDNGSEPFHDTEEFTVPPTMEEIYTEDKLYTEADNLKVLQCQTCAVDRENPTISDMDQALHNSNGVLLDQSIPAGETVTAFVSNDIDGWQRFDVEDGNNVGFGNKTSSQESRPLELWEQLLVNSLENKEEVKESSFLDRGGIESTLQDGNWQIGLASPGNPFIEGLDRLSNFSETEGTILNEEFQSPICSQNTERTTFLHGNEGLNDTANRNEESLSGEQKPNAVVLGNLVDASKAATQYGNQSQTDTNYPSSAGASGLSLQSMELFEAPSFMSLVDPETHELFKASMPVYQTSSDASGYENGGDKWEANFDLMVPPQSQISSFEEITRSISLPRIDTNVVPVSTCLSPNGKHLALSKVQNTSLKSLTPTGSPKAKPSIMLSPKLSPLVKKMVQKVRTTPAVASKVLSTANNMLNPNTVDNKIKQGSIWSCCMCCFSRNKNG